MKAKQLIPELLVEDMPKTLQFYCETLGFKPGVTVPEKNPVFVQIGRDDIHIMLYERKTFEGEIPKLKKTKMGGTVLLYIHSENLKDFYAQIKSKISIIQSLHKTNYGTLEFLMEDCNGYLICFSESIQE